MPSAKPIVVPYLPRVQFMPLHDRKQRWAIVIAHRRAGKTVAASNELIRGACLCTKPKPRFAYIAPFFSQAKDVAWTYLKHYTSVIPNAKANESELYVDLPGFRRVRLYGADNYERMRGLYFDGVVLDEYGDMDPRAWSEVIRATLADRSGWAIFIGTPRGLNHFKDQWDRALLDPEWFTLKLKASETGLIPEAELAEMRKQMSQDQYDAEMECFPAGTMVATTRGNMAIEAIRLNDFVLTHAGRWRPVIEVMSRDYVGSLVEINAFGLTESFLCTPDHPFLVHNRTTQEREWRSASTLTAGECLVLPRATNCAKPLTSPEMVRLIAWFICEGSVYGNCISLSCNPLNQREMEHVRTLVRELGYETREYAANPGVINIFDTGLADMLGAWCGLLAGNKRIPFDIIAGHESLFFDELMLGDGCCVEPVRGGHRWAYTTISRGLALDVQLLAGSLNRRAGIQSRPGGTMISPNNGKIYPKQPSYCVQIPKGLKVNHCRLRECFPTSHGMAYRIRKVGTVQWSGRVYNLSVKEDESYVANGRAVHNCSFEASVIGSYWGREMQAVEKDGRITKVVYQPEIAVDTWWDLGMADATAIWFTQNVGREVHVIDCYENTGEGLPHYAKVLQEKGYVYGKHNAPHDIQVRELGSGTSRLETAANLGIRFETVPNLPISDGIDAARSFLSRCWFDQAKTAAGRLALISYHKTWDEKRKVFSTAPAHNWASHYADAWRYLSVGHKHTPLKQRDTERPQLVQQGAESVAWLGV